MISFNRASAYFTGVAVAVNLFEIAGIAEMLWQVGKGRVLTTFFPESMDEAADHRNDP